MREEEYQVKCPKHIVFGDPLYFEQFKGAKLKKLVVDFKAPKWFDAARLVLQEQENDEFPEMMDRTMTLYLGLNRFIQMHVDGKRFEFEKYQERSLGVDTARYLINVDGRSVQIHTGGDGWWGSLGEIHAHFDGKKPILDAIILSIDVPELCSFKDMKRFAGYLFEDLQPMPLKKQERNENPSR